MTTSEAQSDHREFGPWRSCLWPIHRHELKKLIPMLLIFFFISFDYNVLRTLKDSLLVTAKYSGAEAIPFVKVWAMFPGAILMTFLFTWLSNRFSREKVLYIIMSIFLFYFFIFTFVLYPIRDSIHPNRTADFLEMSLPIGFRGFVAIFRYWTFTLFYVMSELWGNIVLFVLFWGFANQVTKWSEAKRFYGILGVGANLSGIFAGQISVYCCHYNRYTVLSFGEDSWHQSLIMLVSLILIAGCIALALFRWMNAVVLTDPRFYDSACMKVKEEKQSKLSLKQSFSVLLSSKYLLCIAVIVIAYNVAINLTEVLWKHQVKEVYPNPNDYTLYMNQIVSIIGLFATFSSFFISGNVIRKYGWTFTAMLTPTIISLTSISFFVFFFLDRSIPNFIMTTLGATSPFVLVFLASAQNVLSRAAKYSVFDASKEMTFVPLTAESKLIGKAAIDGVCSRLGKSGGAMIHQGLLLIFSTFAATAPYIAIFLVGILIIWAITIRMLGKQVDVLIAQPIAPSIEPQVKTVRLPVDILTDQALLKEQVV